MQNAIANYINALADKHSNAIPIFGYAYHMQDRSIPAIVRKIPTIIENAKFFGWHDTLANACRTFCHCCFVDPALVEVYVGSTFEDFIDFLYN